MDVTVLVPRFRCIAIRRDGRSEIVNMDSACSLCDNAGRASIQEFGNCGFYEGSITVELDTEDYKELIVSKTLEAENETDA